MDTYKTLIVPWIYYMVNVILNQQQLNLYIK